MNEERTGKLLRQVEHTRGHLWQIFHNVQQVMVTTVTLSKWWLQLSQDWDRCLSFCIFSFGHCVVCSSSIYGFWLSLWYLQTLLSFICMFCRSLFVLLYFFFWPLCCLFFFNIRILITSLRYLQTLLSDKLSYNVISSTKHNSQKKKYKRTNNELQNIHIKLRRVWRYQRDNQNP
jgi:hypothetical protein